MEAVLSKLHCRAAISLTGERSGLGFDQTFLSDFKASCKSVGAVLSAKSNDLAAVSNENGESFSKCASNDSKDAENNTVTSTDCNEQKTGTSTDSTEHSASHEALVHGGRIELKTDGKEESIDESCPATIEPVADKQDSKSTEDDVGREDTSGQTLFEKSRTSRRKPQKTHRVLESEEPGDTVFQQYLDEDLRDYMLIKPGSAELNSSDIYPGSTSQSAETGSKVDDLDIDEENIVLPEGTVLVHPEAVDASPQPVELESSRAKRVFRGNLDSAIVHCTACNKQIGLDGFLDIHRHPVLKVLVCRKCYGLYNDLEIEQDSEGSDEQCRWCGQGGDLVCCDFCHNALCKGCIRRNLGRKELGSILSADEGVKWKCYVCDPKPLLNLIEHCTSIMEALTKQEKRQQELENRRKRPDARSKAGAAASVQAQPVSVIRAPSVSVMGRSLLKQVAVKPDGQSRQKPQGYAADAGHGKESSSAAAWFNTSYSGARTATARNGTVFVAMPSSGAASRGLAGSRISLTPVSDQSLLQTLDRLLMATHSMGMFLASLKDDLRRTCGNSAVFNATQMQRRREVASKLWRAHSSYNKSLREGTAQTSEIVRKTNSAAKVLLKSGSTFHNRADVIELSDSDEETNSGKVVSTNGRKIVPANGGKIVSTNGGKIVPNPSSCSQRVIVATNSRSNSVPGNMASEIPTSCLSKEIQSVKTVTPTPTDDTTRSTSAAGNRRKRKQPQQFLDIENLPSKIPHLDETSENNEDDANQDSKTSKDLDDDNGRLENKTERRDGGVLCIEVGDDLEEVMHKIANGNCSSVELSIKQSQVPEIKDDDDCGIVDVKWGENKPQTGLNGHASLGSNHLDC